MDPLRATASQFLALSDISIIVAMADGEEREDLPGQGASEAKHPTVWN